MPKPRKCGSCGGPVERRKVEHPYWHGMQLVVLIQDVPGWVCLLCNRHHFEPAVETTLSYIVKDYIKVGNLFPIPVTPYRVMVDPSKH